MTEDVPPPVLAPFRAEVFEYLPKLAEKYTLVLWTARKGYEYGEAVGRLYQAGLLKYIRLDGDDLPHGDTGKLVASWYIDDRSIFGKLDWNKIYNYLMEV